MLDAYKEWKGSGRSRTEFLERAAQIEGIYVPSFYEAEYHEDGTLKSFTPINDHALAVVRKQIVMDVTDAPYPQKPVVPFIKATQYRVFLRSSVAVSVDAVSARQECFTVRPVRGMSTV